MTQIYIKDFVGVYQRDGKTPNHFVSNHTGIELILKTRVNSTNGMPPNYLLFRKKDSGKFQYFTSLWNRKDGTYKISDTQKPTNYGVCKLDLFSIQISL
jgi:hypothetical protein